jgi:hypothetical protein
VVIALAAAMPMHVAGREGAEKGIGYLQDEAALIAVCLVDVIAIMYSAPFHRFMEGILKKGTNKRGYYSNLAGALFMFCSCFRGYTNPQMFVNPTDGNQHEFGESIHSWRVYYRQTLHTLGTEGKSLSGNNFCLS